MARRGVILPAILFMLLLLGLLGAMFAFRVNADHAATRAVALRLQTRLAAEAGVERVKLLLRDMRFDSTQWYNNPDELHRIIVWAHDVDATILGTNEELDEGEMAFRFSIVADDPSDDEKYIRFGITDEAAKLNLNEATESQLLKLVTRAVGDDEEIIPSEIVAAIIDWRDEDSVALSEAGDTEGDYYEQLVPAYLVKNAPFETVEELLLVKGVTGQILFGEDYDRNGLLTDNEDDGDDSFPPDNEDGELNQGLYPYLTVHSYESNVSNTGRSRIYLFGEENTLREQLTPVFEDEPDVVDYIVQVTRGQSGKKEAGEGEGGEEGGKSGSTGSEGEADGSLEEAGEGSTGKEGSLETSKSGPRQQYRESGSEEEEKDEEDAAEEEAEDDSGEEEEGETNPEDGGETDDVQGGSGPIRTPAALLLARSISGEARSSPVGPEHLARLMDQTTTVSPEKNEIAGLINVNTAPAPVLKCIEELSGAQIQAILEARGSLEAEEKATTAWLVTEDVVDLETYVAIAPQITARGQQFTIESLGYADHVGMVSRLQVIVDMVGPIAQTVYCRDVTNIGGHFPIRQEDEENIRVR